MISDQNTKDISQRKERGRFTFGPLTFSLLPFTFIFLFLPCALSLVPFASGAYASATVTLAWDKNQESDVIGYKVHYGATRGTYQYHVDVKNNTGCSISGLTEGTTYYFAATAYDDQNIESSYSEELAHTIPNTTPPPPPFPVDTDGDGLIDGDENDIYGTDPNKADTDGDGMNDGDELAFWGGSWGDDSDGDGIVNLVDPDSDNDGYNDGSSPPPPPPPPISPFQFPTLEIGEVSIDHNWARITFKKEFTDPVVVAQPLSLNDPEPAVVRIRNVGSTGFDIRIQEWDYLDGSHAKETISFLAIERGIYALQDGTQIEVGAFVTSKVSSFDPVAFNQTFHTAPVVIAGIASFNDSQAVTGRMRNITTEGFEYCMQEQELNSKIHQTETINYIAWEPSAGTLEGLKFEVSKTGDVVMHNFVNIQFGQVFETPPLFFADMQTAGGMDTANVRQRNKAADSVEIQIDEEQSKNTETNHTTEVVGYLALKTNVVAGDSDGDGLVDNEEQDTYGSDSNKADTDSDGINDGEEVQYWGANWNLDYDGDSVINLLDPDSDGDGLSDGNEIENGTDPAVPNSKPESVKIWLEAESGNLISPMELTEDPDSSSGKYIFIPQEYGNNLDPNLNAGYVEYTFHVPAPGEYVIWGRVNSADGGSDSFFVSIDGNNYAQWATQISTTWTWDQVADTWVNDPIIVYLDYGEHTLIIKHREPLTKIDKILITNDMGYVPEGPGEDNNSQPPSDIDTDGDGIFNGVETEKYGTNPEKLDTDGDGINDGDELAFWGNSWNMDSDSDGIINLLDFDSDNDSYSDGEEKNAGFDPLNLESNPGSVKIWFEAESGNLIAPMEVAADSEASSGKYIAIPGGYGNNLDPNSEIGYVEFTFQASVSGEYVIWGRVNAMDGGSDSFFVSVDGSKYAPWPVQIENSWGWDQVFFWGGDDPLIFYLEKGQHTLILKHREPQTKIDKLLITNDMEYIPN